jgi:ribosome-binding protein aMBF1 (putative translation factor)
VTAGSGREDGMKKLDEVLTMLERSRALGLSAEVQATIDAAILAEAGLTKRPTAAAPTIQLDIFSTPPRVDEAQSVEVDVEEAMAEAKRANTARLRALYRGWMQSDEQLRRIGDWIRIAVDATGGPRELAEALNGHVSIVRTYLDGYSAPSDREARILAHILRIPERRVIAECQAAAERIDQLRESHGLRRAVRRTFSNPPFSGEE